MKRYIGGLTRYFYKGIEPGGFLRAVLENDLYGAVNRADSQSEKDLSDIVRLLYNNAPGLALGSRVKVEAWMDSVDPSEREAMAGYEWGRMLQHNMGLSVGEALKL